MARTKVQIPKEVQEQMIRDNRNMPYQQVAKLYGYGRNKTYEVVRGTCPRKAGTSKITQREKKALVEDYQNGLSVKKLATKYGIEIDYVYKILRKNNVELRKNQRTESIQEDLKSGELTQAAIAKKYGVSRQRVGVVKKKMDNKKEGD